VVEQISLRGSCSVRVAETGSELIANCGVTKIKFIAYQQALKVEERYNITSYLQLLIVHHHKGLHQSCICKYRGS
jgi:hypothetical protein